MADHMRKVIRDAVVAALTGLTSTGSNVHATRTQPLEAGHLPALCVYTLDENSELHNMGPGRSLLRDLSLVVEAVAQANGEIDDTLDQIALEVEAAMNADTTFGGKTYDCFLASTRIAVRGAGEKDTGSAVMTFMLRYRTLAANPSTNSI